MPLQGIEEVFGGYQTTQYIFFFIITKSPATNTAT